MLLPYPRLHMEQSELALMIAGAILTWTASVISALLYLGKRFRTIEQRVLRLELKVFGFTLNGQGRE
jgi:hypothetical protein